MTEGIVDLRAASELNSNMFLVRKYTAKLNPRCEEYSTVLDFFSHAFAGLGNEGSHCFNNTVICLVYEAKVFKQRVN